MFGQFEVRQGSAVTMKALLVMTKRRPTVGAKGVLAYAPTGATGDADWVDMGEVEVKRALDGAGRIQVLLTSGEKAAQAGPAKRPAPLAKNTRLRLRWEY